MNNLETTQNVRDNQYQLIEDNVRDVEYHARKHRCKRYLFLIIVLIAIAIGIGLVIFVIKEGNKSESANNGNMDSNNENKDERVCPFNPQYPMLGGPGCGIACVTDQYSASLNFEDAWPQEFLDKIDTATMEVVDIINEQLNLTNSSIFLLDVTQSIHMTMDYFCCLTHDQLQKVNDIVRDYVWPRMDIRFDRAICTQDGWYMGQYYPNDTYIEIMVYATNISQEILLGAVTELEQTIMDANISIAVPRSNNIGFHVTIGFVNGSAIEAAGTCVPDLVDELNKVIIWNDEEITIDAPVGQDELHICTDYKHSIGGRNYSCLTGF